MPEFTAPGIGRESTEVIIEIEVDEEATGVLYAVGGSGGGLSIYMDKGYLVYEYNMMIIENYSMQTKKPIPAGKHQIIVSTKISAPGKSGSVTILIDEKEAGTVELARTVPAAFSATESFDVGRDLGSPVSQRYAQRRPFEFNGKINSLTVKLK